MWLLDAGWWSHGASQGFMHNWDPTPAEFERWLTRQLDRGATLIDIVIHE